MDRVWICSSGSWKTLEEIILEMPEMFLRLNSCSNSIKGKPRCPLTLQGDGSIVYGGLESLSVFTLKHHLKLLPASLVVISFLGINVKGLQVLYNPGIEDFPVLGLVGELVKFWGFPSRSLDEKAIVTGMGIFY